MSTNDVNMTLEIRGGYQGGAEPWSQTIIVNVGPDGFRDAEGIGREGDAPGILEIARVKEMLLAGFDGAELCALLDRLVALRKALS